VRIASGDSAAAIACIAITSAKQQSHDRIMDPMIGRSRRGRIGSDYPFFGARLPILRSLTWKGDS